MMYNFYPRPPRGGRRSCLMISGVAKAISIHALREEGDDLAVNPKAQNRIFLSTPSARRATDDPCPWYCARSDFYPRPPRGGRHRPTPRPDPGSNFYPRPPRGGRPSAILRRTDRESISIHALREEGDSPFANLLNSISRFLSTPSVRRATLSMVANAGAS